MTVHVLHPPINLKKALEAGTYHLEYTLGHILGFPAPEAEGGQSVQDGTGHQLPRIRLVMLIDDSIVEDMLALLTPTELIVVPQWFFVDKQLSLCFPFLGWGDEHMTKSTAHSLFTRESLNALCRGQVPMSH